MFDTGFRQAAPGRSALEGATDDVRIQVPRCGRPAGRSAWPMLLLFLGAEHAVPHVGDGTRLCDIRSNVVQA